MSSESQLNLPNGIVVKIKWDTADLDAVLDRLAARLQMPPVDLLEQVGQIVRRGYAETFRAGGRPSWAALRPATMSRKQGMIRSGLIPPRTATGRLPRRLMQQSRTTGKLGHGAWTILIQTGALRDSWSQKGAKGNVTEITGHTAFFGSQLTVERQLAPTKPVAHYHIVTKKARAARTKGSAVSVSVPLARIHEEGAPRAHIPARPVAHRSDGGANVAVEDLDAIRKAAVAWLMAN